MFEKRIRLFRIFGFQVSIDPSWAILAILIAWSLSMGLFPSQYAGLPTQTYWVMGIIAMLGLFFSIVFHELSHSLVARKVGTRIEGITLFMFGGVAEMGDESPGPSAEFLMAAAGPVSSVVLGGIFYAVVVVALKPGPLAGVVWYLAIINVILAIFNMLPAYPLDGGRILHSILWAWKKDLRRATRIASRIGLGFAILLIVLGVFQFFTGNFLAGLWWFLIGMFLRNSARSAYEQLLIRQALEGEQVMRFMNKDPITVRPSILVKDLVDDYVYKYHHKMFPIVEDSGHLVGCVTTKEVNDVPRQEWNLKRVEQISTPCSEETVVDPQTDAMKALAIMTRTGASRLLVATGDKLVGILALKDMLKFLSLKIEMEET
jgi:Zn-dependent protease/predicted transcriptional regulator